MIAMMGSVKDPFVVKNGLDTGKCTMTGLTVAVPGPSLSKPHSTGKILYSFENWGSQESELLGEGF